MYKFHYYGVCDPEHVVSQHGGALGFGYSPREALVDAWCRLASLEGVSDGEFVSILRGLLEAVDPVHEEYLESIDDTTNLVCVEVYRV